MNPWCRFEPDLLAIPMNRLILFLDFDGTLTPIVARPNLARLSRPVRETLRKLVGLLPVVRHKRTSPERSSTAGRIARVCYVGHHGLSCLEAGGDVTWLTTPPHRTMVRRWLQALRIAAEGIDGALVEDKGMTVALHDRLVKPKQRSRLRRRAWRLLRPMDRARVRQSSAGKSRVGSQIFQSREQRHSRVDAASATVGTSSSAGLFLGTIIRISTHSLWYMAEDLRFESAGDVARPVRMPGYLTPRNSTQFWNGWQQDNRSDGACVTQG